MANTKVSALELSTTLSATDMIYLVDDAATASPLSRRLAGSSIPSFIPDLDNNASPSGSNVLLILGAGGGSTAPQQVSNQNIFNAIPSFANNASPATSATLLVFGEGGGSGTPQKTTVSDLSFASFPNAGARVYSTSAQTLPNNTATALTFELEQYDTHGFHVTTAGSNARFDIPAGQDGTYEFGAAVVFVSNSTGDRFILCRKNGAADYFNQRVGANSVAATQIVASTVTSLVENDYLEIFARQSSGGNLNTNTAANYSMEFWIQRVG